MLLEVEVREDREGRTAAGAGTGSHSQQDPRRAPYGHTAGEQTQQWYSGLLGGLALQAGCDCCCLNHTAQQKEVLSRCQLPQPSPGWHCNVPRAQDLTSRV